MRLLLLIVICVHNVRSESELDVFDNIIANNHDLHLHPNKLTEVGVEFWIHQISKVNEKEMSFTITGYFRQSWCDDRLRFNSSTYDTLHIPIADVSKMWTPDTYFRNQNAASKANVPAAARWLKIDPTGCVRTNLGLVGTYSSPMDFQLYPFDSQTLVIWIENFSLGADKVVLNWPEGDPGTLAENAVEDTYYVVETQDVDCNKNHPEVTWECLQERIVIGRNLGSYILQFYVPSALMVALSWTAFWVDINAGVRMAILLTSIFTMSNLLSSAKSNLPMVSYMKAMDIWLFVCLVFIVLVVVQSIVVKGFSKAEQLRQRGIKPDGKKEDVDEELGALLSSDQMDAVSKSQTNEPLTKLAKSMTNIENLMLMKMRMKMKKSSPEAPKKGGKLSKRINNLSKIFFPAAFLLFTIAYWGYYMSMKQHPQE